MTYKDQVYAILNEDPSATEEDVVAKVGCAVATYRHYRVAWKRDHEQDQKQGAGWAYPPAVAGGTCEKCPYAEICHRLDALQMPLLCQSVPHPEKRRLEALKLIEDFEAIRAYVIEKEEEARCP